ncbi:hypothetical protein NDU88_006312 [Pleurodeles waltl]|uniref:Uncharacterized protein n=1 Tax=Pleurodeles waltl TaxID=8319 RepID=A0AAV7SP43_PLEWA|nr:hypothetical protein NDU88_006312 [Pleurodeles waltl]
MDRSEEDVGCHAASKLPSTRRRCHEYAVFSIKGCPPISNSELVLDVCNSVKPSQINSATGAGPSTRVKRTLLTPTEKARQQMSSYVHLWTHCIVTTTLNGHEADCRGSHDEPVCKIPRYLIQIRLVEQIDTANMSCSVIHVITRWPEHNLLKTQLYFERIQISENNTFFKARHPIVFENGTACRAVVDRSAS